VTPRYQLKLRVGPLYIYGVLSIAKKPTKTETIVRSAVSCEKLQPPALPLKINDPSPKNIGPSNTHVRSAFYSAYKMKNKLSLFEKPFSVSDVGFHFRGTYTLFQNGSNLLFFCLHVN